VLRLLESRLIRHDFAIARPTVKSRLHPINMIARRQDIILPCQGLISISSARLQNLHISTFSPLPQRVIDSGWIDVRLTGVHAIV